MIKDNFLHIKERDIFESLKEDIRDESLTFIKETGTLFHKGKEFLQPRWKEIGEPPVNSSTANTLDVVFANKETGKLKIDGDWSIEKYPTDIWEPIGIVVIPGDHGVLKDGTGTINQCGVMSIVPMSYNTPEVGATTEGLMYWGGYGPEMGLGDDITGKSDGLNRYDSINDGLKNYNRVACDTSASNTSTRLSDTNLTYLPRQGSIGGRPTWHSNASNSGSGYTPSPYKNSDLMSGAYNEAYGTTEFDGSNHNPLADFKGVVNTKIITDLSTLGLGEDWKTSSSIVNSYYIPYYPAACCCARFHTTGTKAFKDCLDEELRNGTGFWYLPACGELGYIVPRLYDINDIIDKLNKTYGIGVQLNIYANYWSSSENSSSSTWLINTNLGYVGTNYKKAGMYVRAFMRL